MNDFGQRLFGYAEEELIGRSVLELIVPDTETSGTRSRRDDPGHPAPPGAVRAQRETRTWGATARASGSRGNTPIVDSQGRLAEILSTGIDTTDRKRAEDALRANEERFRELAVRDNLTGLYNTRYLYQALEELIKASGARAIRSRSCSSISTASSRWSIRADT